MCLGPKRPGRFEGVDSSFAPPCGFITRSVHLAMMAAAQRDDELIAHLAPERTMLCKAKMMGICRASSANQTGLFGHEFNVGPVPKPARLRNGEQAFVNTVGS